ncbi:hypothetical protein PFICI_08659 [Pestalotiopsis fici W106-1]|uniref:Heterokaryon incompatibility domain-containing protein n=1 Tax=Pestalotiopsis fici (strain W106-1 / CGMCC3.15140) TaxID=1229662 RepID=W3X0X9_PESFW|nr:uncharacterized protein PFICI_08659 [Pestalotiopsis fici W106-1]ETS78806.1 hypothetical protein PFICI_08659 [Pestalotiopsis fici W106-1]
MSDERIELDKPSEQDLKPACSSLSLCSICRQIFANPYLPRGLSGEEFKHHTSHKDVVEAAEQRCYICRLLRDRLADPDLRVPLPTQSESATPLRFLYKLKKLAVNVTITFSCLCVGGSSTKLLDLMVQQTGKQLATDCSGHTTWSASIKERARQWVRDESAERTVLDPNRFPPKRLLHVRSLSEDEQYQVSLCEDNALPRGTQYLTLSHRWGQNKFLRLMESNIEKFKQCVPYQLLPKNFRDAIKITCDLGFNYLWIDSLCIIQDSKEDWFSQGLNMGQIYQNATCNISADVAHDSEAGLIRSRDIETFLPLQVDDVAWRDPAIKGDGLSRYVIAHEPWRVVSSAPLANRAWVFQERLLSPKIMHFTTRQVFFEAKTEEGFSEQWPNAVPNSWLGSPSVDTIVSLWRCMNGAMHTSEERWSTWTHLVETYSQMRLTYDTDRLAALSGIVKEVQRNTGDEYVAGLWKKDLLLQLLWHSKYLYSSNRTQQYTAPTWSWASTGTAVWHGLTPDRFYYGQKNRVQVLCKLVEAQTSPMMDQDNTGAIKAGFLRLQGSLREARLSQSDPKGKAKPYWTVGHSRKKIAFLPDVITPADLNKPQDNDHYKRCLKRVFRWSLDENKHIILQPTITVHPPTQSVFLLPILSTIGAGIFATMGLTLIPTDRVRGQFHRVGLFLTVHHSGVASILHHPCDIEESYYEKKNRGRYTISII